MGIDSGLAVYHSVCGRNDYLSERGKDKSMEFVYGHGIGEDQIGAVLGDFPR